LKSKKYDMEAFWASLYLTEVNRYWHIKGYIKGYWGSDERKRQGAMELARVLG